MPQQANGHRAVFFLETVARDIAFAFRMLQRTPLIATTVVSTIALGLGIVTVAFTFFNAFFFRVDAVRNPDELFAVERPTRPDFHGHVPFSWTEYEAIRRGPQVFTDVAAARPSIPTRISGRAARGMFVSANFFDLLGVAAARGRTLTSADNEDGATPVVVLTQLGWEKFFAEDPGVVGRALLVNGQPYQVVGVMPRDFRGLSQEPQDYWAPLALLDQVRPERNPKDGWVDVIGRLKPGTSRAAATIALTAWASAEPTIRKGDDGVIQLHLRESRGVISEDRAEAMVLFMPILFAFGLILMIGCANVANLLLARGVSRQREIGVRLSLGATRPRIVRQLLTESLLLAVAAAALGFLVSRALLAGSIHLTLSLLPPEFTESMDVIAPPGDWRVCAFLFAAAFVAAVMFGLVPALHSTRIELVRAIRGEVTRDARPSRVRQLFIASQVTASTLLLVCAGVFLRSSYSAATADVGIRSDDTVVVRGMTESARPRLLRAIEQHASVASFGASWPEPTQSGATTEVSAGDTHVEVGCKLVSQEYFDLLGIHVRSGRIFAPGERSPASGVIVISEAVAQRFWPNERALGQTIRLSPPAAEGPPAKGTQLFTVIGVVGDVRSALKMFDFTYSGIYLPTTPEQSNTSLVLRVHGDPDTARRTLLDALTKVDPTLGDVATMRMMARLEAAVLGVVFWMAVILSGLALTLTISGLFGVLSYLVEQRRKEIGVRMALGAMPRDIVTLVVSQSTRPVAVGVLAGAALAAVTAIVLLSIPAAEMIGTLVHPFDPLAYAASLGVIIATCLAAAFIPARRAARINPSATLRAD
jgi:predicted permease